MAVSEALSNPVQVQTLVSIHDVMPETLAAVNRVLDELVALAVTPVTLLVVPGRAWSSADLDQLRAFERQGCRLAAHGWRHQVDVIQGLYHRLHAAVLSRHVAEHLALNADGILKLLRRSRQWFIDHDFAAPSLYVPPAWAMGGISRARLSAEGPFDSYEVFGGLYQAKTGCWQPTPMLGYEADCRSRVLPLQLWNQFNRQRARSARWLRMGIHPQDLNYALAEALRADLRRFNRYGDYPAVSGAADVVAPQPHQR